MPVFIGDDFYSMFTIKINPDLVITDYIMPDKNGVELIEQLQAQGVSASFVLLTANSM